MYSACKIRYISKTVVDRVDTSTFCPPAAGARKATMIINLTPHAVDIYRADSPGVVDPQRHRPITSIKPSGTVARLAEEVLSGQPAAGAPDVPIVLVEYGHVIGLPPAQPGVWYVVSLPLALALPARRDLLVSYRQVRSA